MKQRAAISVILGSAGFLALIFDSVIALEGAISGIEICLKTVIPSLFPFFVLMLFLTDSLSGCRLTALRSIGRLFGVPEGAEGILLCSFLGGYPAGAHSISAAYQNRTLSREDACRMLTFCNNAGPAFLFGMLSHVFPHLHQLWLLWGIQILSALIVARLLPRSRASLPVTEIRRKTPSDIMLPALRAMAQVCGWIILFRIILSFLSRWILWILPDLFRISIWGMLELSNGCLLLSQVPDISLRFILASGFLSFGGLCVTMQTRSVAWDLFGVSYFRAKILQTAISILLACAVCFRWPLLILMGVFCLFQVCIFRKRSSIPEPSVV